MKQIIGSSSSLVAGACCLGLTPLLSGLTAVGLGFLINDLILLPLLAIALTFTLWVLWSAGRRHKLKAPFYVAIVATAVAFVGLWVFVPLSYAGFAMLFGTTIWDYIAGRRSGMDSAETGAVS